MVLAVQDTTSLNYTRHPAEERMGPINTTQDGGEAVGVVGRAVLGAGPGGGREAASAEGIVD